jgi:uncharacterized protein
MSGPEPEQVPAIEVVEQFVTRAMGGDRDGAMKLLHPDFRIQQPESLPHGGWYEGAEGMAEMGARFGRYWDRTIGPPRILACGDTAVQITSQTWTAKETGRTATVDVVELFAVTDGLLAEIRVFQQDTHLLLETLQQP